MPAPQARSASLDKNGCHKIQVMFDEPIAKANDVQCSNYLTDNTISKFSLTGITDNSIPLHAFYWNRQDHILDVETEMGLNM